LGTSTKKPENLLKKGVNRITAELRGMDGIYNKNTHFGLSAAVRVAKMKKANKANLRPNFKSPIHTAASERTKKVIKTISNFLNSSKSRYLPVKLFIEP
jgi:hypothetical protein